MSKVLKNKKDKVPKITEEEYAAYISSLKGMTEGVNGGGGMIPATSEILRNDK
ncbi:MAG: hypothetical protein IJV83_03725 [Clostridia bacterium]|nr:hypothetical protein [Clostridia bacterium]